jgi:hypothetical protein
LGAGAEGVIVGKNLYGKAGTAAIYHSAEAVRCLINGLGRNHGDPAVAGDWLGYGYDGIRVWDDVQDGFYTHAAGAWRVG